MKKKSWFVLVAVVIASLTVIAQAGTLYAVRESGDRLVSIDTDTLVFTDIGPLGITFDFGGLGWDSSTSTLYMIGGRPSQALYTVDTNTGAATLVGSHNVNDLFGLAYDSKNDALYASVFTAGQPLYTLNRSNGSATPGPALSQRLGGLAYNSRDDDLIGVHDGAGDLYSIDRNTGRLTLLYDGPYTNDSGLAYDPEKHVLWDIDWNGTLCYFDIANGYQRTDVKTGLGPHDGLAFGGGGFDCDLIKKFKLKCRNNKLKAIVKSSLPEGVQMTIIDNGDETVVTTNAKGKAKLKKKNQTGIHDVSIKECPEIKGQVDCG